MRKSVCGTCDVMYISILLYLIANVDHELHWAYMAVIYGIFLNVFNGKLSVCTQMHSASVVP